MHTADVVIAGAGIIGLSAALELAHAGLSVAVIERGTAMREASWAAAGMLAAHDPENPPEMRALSEYSLALYPSYLATIERLSGRRVPLRTKGTLQAVSSRLRHSDPGDGRPLTHAEAKARVPEIAAPARSFLWLDEQSLDPRELCSALPMAALSTGIRLLEQRVVRRVEQAANHVRIETVITGSDQAESMEAADTLTARHYIHCCGAWSGLGALPGNAMPVEPRKGQMLTVTMPLDAPPLEYVVRTPELYLVPRGDGRVVIGATIEQAGLNRTVTDAAMSALLAAAAELWPPILRGAVTDRWAGLRPWTPDALPVLGGLPDHLPGGLAGGLREASPDSEVPSSRREQRRWIATGHFRNGILLAPGTARLLRQLIAGEKLDVDLYPFRPGRFAASPDQARDKPFAAAL